MPGAMSMLRGAAARCLARIVCQSSGLRLTERPPGILACLDRIRKQVIRHEAVPGSTLKHRAPGVETQVRKGQQANGEGCSAAPAAVLGAWSGERCARA